jgi:hypothetical protein
MLAIEYDVSEAGHIELVALVNAVSEDGEDPDGAAWLAWRRSFDDGGMGCAPVAPDDLRRLETTEDPDRLRRLVESLVLADRAAKQAAAATGDAEPGGGR